MTEWHCHRAKFVSSKGEVLMVAQAYERQIFDPGISEVCFESGKSILLPYNERNAVEHAKIIAELREEK